MQQPQRFEPLTEATMTAEQQRVSRSIWSTPRNSALGLGPFNSLLRSPELADRVQRVGEHVRFHSAVPTRLTELAVLITARRWTAQYEWWAHHPIALAAGLDPAIADAIAGGVRPQAMPPEEAAVYDFCTELLERGAVDDARFDALRGLFGEQGVIDLVGTLGYYGLISMVLNVDRCPLPGGAPLPLAPLG